MCILKTENGFIVPVKYVKAEELYGIENIDYSYNKNSYMYQVKDDDVEKYTDIQSTNTSCEKINIQKNKGLNYENCSNCKINCSLQKHKEELAEILLKRNICTMKEISDLCIMSVKDIVEIRKRLNEVNEDGD